MSFGTYERLSLHSSASARDVIRAAKRKLKPQFRKGRKTRYARHAFYREMLSHHRDWQSLCRRYRM